MTANQFRGNNYYSWKVCLRLNLMFGKFKQKHFLRPFFSSLITCKSLLGIICYSITHMINLFPTVFQTLSSSSNGRAYLPRTIKHILRDNNLGRLWTCGGLWDNCQETPREKHFTCYCGVSQGVSLQVISIPTRRATCWLLVKSTMYRRISYILCTLISYTGKH